MKKKVLSILLCLAMLLTAFPAVAFAADEVTPVTTIAAPANTIATSKLTAFTDVKAGSQYETAIQYCTNNGYMFGVGGNKFGTESAVTRGMVVTVLWRASGSPVVNYAMPFADVDDDAWYAEAVRWAASEKIISGTGNAKFAPDDEVTNQDLATMVYAYERYQGGGFTGSGVYNLPFEDKNKIAEYAYEGVSWLYLNDVLANEDDAKFSPKATATRAEFAYVIQEYTSLDDKIQFVPTDYSDMENWAFNDYGNAEKKDTQADVFFIYPTIALTAEQENGIVSISDTLKAGVKKQYVGATDCFNDGVRFYEPYYRQLGMDYELENTKKNEDLPNLLRATEAKADVFAALDYYFENYNEGRPFIIAGYSQGAAFVQVVLEDYFGQEDNSAYLDQMVAAYSIGYGVDKNWLENLGYLTFATGAYDTGVVISWNTEGPGATEKNVLLADNPSDTLVINPITWTTDNTYAKASECAGSTSAASIVTPGLYNLQIDSKRGCLICDNNAEYMNFKGEKIFGGKSLHTYELTEAYLSVRENMHDRIDAYIAKNSKSLDYSKAENWMYNDYADASKKDTKADVIFIYGTENSVPAQENGIAALTDEVKEAVKAHGVGTSDVFDDDTRMYIPYYRQISLVTALEGIEKGHQYLPDKIKSTEAIVDLSAALDYYFENYNEGRPFIIAGYSQGGACVQAVLEDYFGQEENKAYLEQLVAAYSIAYGVDKTWLDTLDYIDFAEGAYDTGVLLSWVTEGVGGTGSSMLVADDPANALVINPINWKRDNTYAKAEECLGTYDADGTITEKGLYNLQFSAERGCLICDNNTNYISAPGYENLWGGTSLHVYEVKQAYGSIRQNMHDRIDAFLAKE